MTAKTVQPMRCAIYTRKSTEHGIELEFNSLHAQRDACEAYIKSQAHEGWRALSQIMTTLPTPARHWSALRCNTADRYRGRPGQYRGGLQDRPAYEITRRLRQARRALRQEGVSFVAVTQQFNTTTSMGRLTLNVLLSFAQFERELSSERVRDKVAASRRKGKWTGGGVPLGYDADRQKA